MSKSHIGLYSFSELIKTGLSSPYLGGRSLLSLTVTISSSAETTGSSSLSSLNGVPSGCWESNSSRSALDSFPTIPAPKESPRTLMAVRNRNQSMEIMSVTSSTGSPTAVSTMDMVTRPADGMPAAPMAAAVAVNLQLPKTYEHCTLSAIYQPDSVCLKAVID
ncbi:hypothetical protein MAR_037067 [Mya arenaria]|uniref:Uncharacterized protein n=1 Tax=Mya arenaria TaxID=6604 RepID=A0ABY7FMF4_MYAAR|nr:hypothetical protein MAR_037067 [Mya arenaria]